LPLKNHLRDFLRAQKIFDFRSLIIYLSISNFAALGWFLGFQDFPHSLHENCRSCLLEVGLDLPLERCEGSSNGNDPYPLSIFLCLFLCFFLKGLVPLLVTSFTVCSVCSSQLGQYLRCSFGILTISKTEVLNFKRPLLTHRTIRVPKASSGSLMFSTVPSRILVSVPERSIISIAVRSINS